MYLKLTRKWNTIDGIYGELGVYADPHNPMKPSFTCYTVELPWRDNQRMVSCIPLGAYVCKPEMYNRGGYMAYELQEVPNRSEILIHVANAPNDLAGCIGVGKSFGWIGMQYGVISSGDTFKALLKAIKEALPEDVDSFVLIIEEGEHNYGR